MQSIRALEPRITNVVQAMMDRIDDAQKSGKTINLYHMFSAYALDIVTEYALGKDLSMNFMSNPEFGKAWADLTMGSVSMNNFGRHFKWLMATMMSLPQSVTVKLNPQVGRFLDWQNTLTKQVQHILDERPGEKTEDEPMTVFQELIRSDLPPEDKTLLRLRDEASMVLGAGGETTAWVLTRTFYHLLQNPSVVERLGEEMKTAIPDPSVMPSLAMLQNLPYLNAIVDEGVRISFPVPARSPRVFRDHTLQYGKWTIQPGVSSIKSVHAIHTDIRCRPLSPCLRGWCP